MPTKAELLKQRAYPRSSKFAKAADLSKPEVANAKATGHFRFIGILRLGTFIAVLRTIGCRVVRFRL